MNKEKSSESEVTQSANKVEAENPEEELIMPGQTRTVNVDIMLFMFCYSWRGANDPYPNAFATRQPTPENSNQSTAAYGRRAFEKAAANAIDVMVGFQVIRDGHVSSVYSNFINSISWHTGQPDVPKIALSMEFNDARDPQVRQQVTNMRNEMVKSRYYRFYDRHNQLRVPVFNWGIYGLYTDLNLTTPDLNKINAIGGVLKELRKPVGDAVPFVIWDDNMLRFYDQFVIGNQPAANAVKTNVLDNIDGLYQHSCYIPAASVPANTIGPNYDWGKFPSYSFDDIAPGTGRTVLDMTVQGTKDVKALVSKYGLKSAGNDGAMYIIPGTFPQYSRERQSYYEYTLNSRNSIIRQSRVKCTDVHQLRRLFHAMRNEASNMHFTVSPGVVNVQRMFALTSWNEVAEGTMWEPCRQDSNDPNKFGISDWGGDFLIEVKGALNTYSYQIDSGVNPQDA
jgi:hypothetical protein